MSFLDYHRSSLITVFNCKDLIVNIFDFLELKDIKTIRTTNKIFYLASNKYKDEFKFWCNKCEEGGYIDYESYYEYRKFNDIHKNIYKEYIRDVIIKEFDEYLCKCCRSKCSNCLTIKNKKNLKYNTDELSYWYGNYVCREGCKKKCDKCNKQIKNKVCRHFDKGIMFEPFLSIGTQSNFLEDINIKGNDKEYVLSMVNECNVVCEKCLRNYHIYGNEY